MTEVYIHFRCAHYGLYENALVVWIGYTRCCSCSLHKIHHYHHHHHHHCNGCCSTKRRLMLLLLPLLPLDSRICVIEEYGGGW